MASIFAGEIPVELGKLVDLEKLLLNNNGLAGALWYVPSYHTTNWLLIWRQISGNIPVELGQFVNLKELCLDENKLAGALVVCSIIPRNKLASNVGLYFSDPQ